MLLITLHNGWDIPLRKIMYDETNVMDASEAAQPTVVWVLGPIPQGIYEFMTQILKYSCSCYLRNNDQIRSQFCTWHGSGAAMTCAEVWPDRMTRIEIKANEFSQVFNYEFINLSCNVSLVASDSGVRKSLYPDKTLPRPPQQLYPVWLKINRRNIMACKYQK